VSATAASQCRACGLWGATREMHGTNSLDQPSGCTSQYPGSQPWPTTIAAVTTVAPPPASWRERQQQPGFCLLSTRTPSADAGLQGFSHHSLCPPVPSCRSVTPGGMGLWANLTREGRRAKRTHWVVRPGSLGASGWMALSAKSRGGRQRRRVQSPEA
jgi:hypothetical protein